MNVIDISNYQNGIDLTLLFKENPLDGVIIKATEAVGYVNPNFKKWAEWLCENNKPWGAYHYCAGMDAIAEAEFFYSKLKPYVGRCIPCADYEGDTLQRGTAWLKEFLDEFYLLSGVRCLVYCSQSVTQSQNFTEIAKDYRLWMAQYADFSPVYGFKDNPWHSGSVAPFNGWQIHQYTSCGILNGYGKKVTTYDENGMPYESYTNLLDLDKFYGTAEDWQALCRADDGETIPSVDLKGPDPTIVSQVMMNRYGIGTDREARLLGDGYDPAKVQAKINELYGIAVKLKPYCSGNMDYINSIIKILKQI